MANSNLLLLLFAFVALLAVGVSGAPSRFRLTPGRYNTKGGPVPGKLNVHVVAHTHDDVGWLKTVDEYYMGANNSIQNAGVQYILDSVMLALQDNPDRKFIYVEIAFFKRWWEQQSDAKKDQVRGFVRSGQLEFINGGWCMSDEAAPYYVDMVDQQTLGHQFLLKEIGPDAIPKTGWQIDPFGHSSFMATLYSLMGFNSWFFARSDYQDWNTRAPLKNLETIMRPSPSLGNTVNIFTGALPGYGPPDGYDWDYDSGDAPIQDDPRLEDVNVDSRVDGFVKHCLELSNIYRTNNVMLTMGSDFNYLNANTWFKNLDKIIHYTNLDGRINVFYSTPTLYTNEKYKANLTWSAKDDDYFPYADSPHAFWTGYFTSRPAIKGYVRSRSNYLQACRQMELQFDTAARSQLLWEDMGLAQHHDAVSGTEKQHVADDYARHLSEGTAECKKAIDEGLNNLLRGQLPLTNCPYINQSICPATLAGKSFAVIAYNSLAKDRTEWVRIPIPASRTVVVTDSRGAAVSHSIAPVYGEPGVETLVFAMTVPALGHSTSFVNFTGEVSAPVVPEPAVAVEGNVEQTIENGIYRIAFDSTTGLATTITDLRNGQKTKFVHNWGWYNASDGNVPDNQNRGQASGAYIFRPNCTENTVVPCRPWAVGPSVSLSFTRTPSFQEAYQEFSPWVTNVVRLYPGSDAIEIEYTVGPVPFQDGLGREVVALWSTDLASNAVWYTDSNGRDMQKRVRNYRPTWKLNVTDPVSGNYYPVDSSIYMADGSRQMTVVTDRSQGGSSLVDGQLEVMVHRRLLHDDSRGVGEPLNETGVDGKGLVITGTHRVILSSPSIAARLHHTQKESLQFPLLLSFTPLVGTPQQFISKYQPASSGVRAPLPPNLHLLTSMDNSFFGAAGTMLLRITHLYAINEDPVLGQPVTVNLDDLFSRISLGNCNEMSVTANQPLADVHRYQWATQTSNGEPLDTITPVNGVAPTVTIRPMEIRTWNCAYTRL